MAGRRGTGKGRGRMSGRTGGGPGAEPRYLLTTPAMGWRSTAEAGRAAGPHELHLFEEVIAPQPTADGAYD